MSSLSFFTGEYDGATIRVTEDGRFSVADVLAAFAPGSIVNGQKARNINAHQTFKSLENRYPEVCNLCSKHKFPGQGQRNTLVATQKNCEEILRLLGWHPEQSIVTSDKFFPRTEGQIVSVLSMAFADLQPVSQFNVHGYRIDLYLAKVNVAVEIDEYGHSSYDNQAESLREQRIKAALECSFVRCNPYANDFNLGDTILKIRELI